LGRPFRSRSGPSLLICVTPRAGRRPAACPDPSHPLARWGVGEATAVYRPRHPECQSFYRIFERRFDEYVGAYEERFEPQSGPLRAVVSRTVAAYLDCGRLFNGFARIRCASCGGEHLLAFSCQTRNSCPICQSKRAARFTERLAEEIAAPVVHRHLVFTVPKALRGLFQRERTLLGLLSRCAYDAVRRAFARPGEFLPVGSVNAGVIEEIFRRLLLRRLHEGERLSAEFRDTLLGWVSSGFSVYVGPRVHPDDPEHFERLARYIARVPMPQKDVRLTGEGQVRVGIPPHPRTGQTELVLDPLEWIHQVVQQIPAPRQHLVRYYGAYSNRKRLRLRQAREWGGRFRPANLPRRKDTEVRGRAGRGCYTGSSRWIRCCARSAGRR